MTTLRSSSFLRLFVLPFVLSFWVSACSTSSWRPIEASPLTADAVADADSLRVITADSQQRIFYPEIAVLADSLVGLRGVVVPRQGRRTVERTRTAIPLDSIQRVERIREDKFQAVTTLVVGVGVIALFAWMLNSLSGLDYW